MTFLGVDHVDMRVPSLAAVEPFYDRLFAALGLPRKRYSWVDSAGGWADASVEAHNVAEYYEESQESRLPRFIGIIEDRAMTPTLTRLAFRVSSRDELDAWHARLLDMDARNVEWSTDLVAYPALFFEDPCGTKLEICARGEG